MVIFENTKGIHFLEIFVTNTHLSYVLIPFFDVLRCCHDGVRYPVYLTFLKMDSRRNEFTSLVLILLSTKLHILSKVLVYISPQEHTKLKTCILINKY